MSAWKPPVDVPLVSATFVNHFFCFGPIYSFGVFLPPIKAHFETSVDAAATVQSVMISMQFFGSLLAGLLIPRFVSHRTVAAACSVLVLAGYLMAASMEALVPMYVAMAMVGTGLGASNLAGLTALNARIKERRALAVGIAACGTSVGSIVLAPVYTALISGVGLRWALRITGIAAAAGLAVTAPFFWVARPPSPADSAGGVLPGSQAKAVAAAPSARTRSASLPCRDARFLCWWLNMLLCMSGYFIPTTLLAQYGQEEVGASAEATSLMYTVIGVTALTTRAMLGCLTHLIGGARRLHALAQVGAGAMTLVLPLCRSTETLMVWSAIFGLTIGPLIAIISVILSELFGTEVLPLYHGVSRLAVGIGSFVGPPLIALVVDQAGYHIAFPLAGALQLSGTVFLVLLAWLQLHHARREASELHAASAESSTCDRERPAESSDGLDGSPSDPIGERHCSEAEEPRGDKRRLSWTALLGTRLCCPAFV